MKRLFLLLGLYAGPALAEPPPGGPPPAKEASPAIDPTADAQLRKMSDYLASLRSFKVDAEATDEMVTQDGQKLQFVADSRISVRRPDRLRSDRLGAFADTIIRYDGNRYSVFGNRTGYYATAPAPPTLDAAIDVARARYGIDAPASDLWLSRPYPELMQDVKRARYIGLEPVEGKLCHHLAFQGSDVDWQIWIEDGPRPLPHRYVVSTKDQPTKPEFTVALTNWEPNAHLDDSVFAFVPPKGAQRIELLPLIKQGKEPQLGKEQP
jgi:hypothetical protein